MIGYTLPTSLNIGGVEYFIRTDYRAILDILIAMNDPEVDEEIKPIIMLKILIPDFEKIPRKHLNEASEKAVEFIDCGQKDDGKPSPKTLDWEQDAGLIIPAINNVAKKEIRAMEYMHWWTFVAYFAEIKEGTLSNVLTIRQKKQKGKPLEKWEKEFYKENKHLVDFQRRETEEERHIKDEMLKWL